MNISPTINPLAKSRLERKRLVVVCLASHPPQSPKCPARPSPATEHGKRRRQCRIRLSGGWTTRRKGIRTAQAAAQLAEANASSKTNHGVHATNCAKLCEYASARRDRGWHRFVALQIFVAFGLFAGIADPEDHSEAEQGRAPRGGGALLLFFSVLCRLKLTRDNILVSAQRSLLVSDKEHPACLRSSSGVARRARVRHVSRVVSLYQRGT